jgi:hypothetical protein
MDLALTDKKKTTDIISRGFTYQTDKGKRVTTRTTEHEQGQRAQRPLLLERRTKGDERRKNKSMPQSMIASTDRFGSRRMNLSSLPVEKSSLLHRENPA